jgi:hypothetical protein
VAFDEHAKRVLIAAQGLRHMFRVSAIHPNH